MVNGNGSVQKFLDAVVSNFARKNELGGILEGVAHNVLQDTALLGFEECASRGVPMQNLKGVEHLDVGFILALWVGLYEAAKCNIRFASKIRSAKGFRNRMETYCTLMMQFVGLCRLTEERAGSGDASENGFGSMRRSVERKLAKIEEIFRQSAYLVEYRQSRRCAEWNSVDEPRVNFFGT